MAETDSQVLTAASERRSAAARRSPRKFYVTLAVLMALIVVAGFWPSYYGPLLRGTAQAPWILHVHGVIYAGWMALLMVQATLAGRGRLRAHQSLGRIGIGYGALILAVGLLVSFLAPAMHVNAGEWTIDEAAEFLPIPLVDMVLFGGLFIAAAVKRGQPELHKRLMLLATIALLFAAAFRLNAAGVPFPAAILLWYVPVLLGMAYDVVTRRKIHPVYWIGAAAMGLSLLRLPLGTSEPWLAIGRPIIEAIT